MSKRKPLTVLVASAGSGAGLLECIRDSARKLRLDLRLLAVDPNPGMSAACRLADRSYAVPDGTEPGFVPALLEVCRKQQVSLLLPTIDAGLIELSEQQDAFAAIGTDVAISSPAVVRLARDKLATAERLKAGGINVPHTMALHEFVNDPNRLSWPVIAKPISGTSSVGILKPRRAGELQNMDDRYIVQELWQGREFTVNVYFDRRGRMRCAIPHWRIEVRNGAVANGRTERIPILAAAAEKLGAVLAGARGPVCFQAIVADADNAAVFEVNARIGSGYPLAHRAGAEFTRWLLEEAAGRRCTASDRWSEGATMLRYDAAVFCKT